MHQEKIWDYFQADQDVDDAFAQARARYQFLARRLNSGIRVLNIGVGRGGLEALLLAKGVHVSSLDPGDKSIEALREKYLLGDRAQVGYSQAMPFPDAGFDVVVMSEVLEHLDDEVLSRTLIEVERVLVPGGRFIGTVPADENLQEGRVMCPHCGKPFHRWGHLQSFGKARLEALLTHGFQAVHVSRHFFGDPRPLNFKGKIGWLTKKGLVMAGLKGGGESYFFSARKS